MNRRPLVRTLLASAAIAAAIALSGCTGEEVGTEMMPGRALAPLSEKMLADLNQKNMDKDSPILVRIFKSEAELEVWKQNRDGEFALLKTYPICRWSGDLGPKVKEGDRQAPEGFYNITPGQMNPRSAYYLAFNIGYPNAYDRSLGRSGSELMVHGDCSSRGCYAMTDEQISEIYSLARESFFGGQKAFQVQAYPFHMTAENMARHRNSPHLAFWKMLKEGSDLFEITHQQPKVDFCERRYVFDAVAPAGSTKPLSFSAASKCPIYELPPDIKELAYTRKRQDEQKFAELVASGTPTAPVRSGVDGGMNPVFLAKLDNRTSDSDGRGLLTPATMTTNTSLPLGKYVVPPAQTAVDTTDDQPAAAAPAKPAPATRVASAPASRAAAQSKTAAAAPMEPAAAPAPAPEQTGIAGLLNGMFQQSAQPQPSDDVGLRGSESAEPAKPAKPTRNVTPARAKPQPHELASAPGATRPIQVPAPKSVASAPTPTPPAQQAQAAAPQEMRSAYNSPPPAQANNNGLLSGAQPTVPVGSFNSRWSGM